MILFLLFVIIFLVVILILFIYKANYSVGKPLSQAVDSLTNIAANSLDSRLSNVNLEFDSKKELIDRELNLLNNEIQKVNVLVQNLEEKRASQLGQLHQQLMQLDDTTSMLRNALVGSKSRGQWGERMAEDVLRSAGFVEEVNYQKQKSNSSTGIPDFTFLLPNDLCLFMDVKFPLDNYLKYLESPQENKAQFLSNFIKDVKNRVKELESKKYHHTDKSLDFILLFIPNEDLYSFIYQQESNIFDEALKKKIICCSPLTLFAVLSVIRHSLDSFQLVESSQQVIEILGGFSNQWEKFIEQMDRVEKSLETTQRAFQALVGTRRNQLERQLDKIEALKKLNNSAGKNNVSNKNLSLLENKQLD